MNENTKKSLYNICVNQKDLLLVDVMNHLHRFMYAYSDLDVCLSDGTIYPTGHLYGFLNFLISLKDGFPGCAIVLALEGSDKERRNVNKEYKAGRPNHDNLYEAVQELVCLCSLVSGVYTVYHEDYEADDAIHMVADMVRDLCQGRGIQKNIWVLSTDKDFYQLIRDDGFAPIKSIRKFGYGNRWLEDAEIVDEEVVRETFNGVSPRDVVKFRCLTGDRSDNLKGYYRFLKSNAAIVANNFDYDVTEKRLVLKPGVSFNPKWSKFMKVIQEDMSVFQNNYAIMKMKDFDFEVTPVSYLLDGSQVRPIVERALEYELRKFLRFVSKPEYSRFSSLIFDLVEELDIDFLG